MRIPKVSIGRLMGLTVVLGLEFAAFRALHGRNYLIFFLAGPMIGILTVACSGLIRWRGRGPAANPFLTGFLAFGVLATAASIGLSVVQPDRFNSYLMAYGNPIERGLRAMGYPLNDPPWDSVISLVFGPPPILGPQLLVAALGGWLNSRYRVTIARRDPDEGSSSGG